MPFKRKKKKTVMCSLIAAVVYEVLCAQMYLCCDGVIILVVVWNSLNIANVYSRVSELNKLLIVSEWVLMILNTAVSERCLKCHKYSSLWNCVRRSILKEYIALFGCYNENSKMNVYATHEFRFSCFVHILCARHLSNLWEWWVWVRECIQVDFRNI